MVTTDFLSMASWIIFGNEGNVIYSCYTDLIMDFNIKNGARSRLKIVTSSLKLANCGKFSDKNKGFT